MATNYLEEYYFIKFLIEQIGLDFPEHIYHYTDLKATKGIIKDGVFWATNAHYLNDKTEIKHARQLIKNLINTRIKFAKEQNEIVFLEELQHLFLKKKKHDIYIISFSLKDDDINQWKEYTKKPTGICIKINTSDFMSRLCIPIFGHQVIYSDILKAKLINNVIDYLMKQYTKEIVLDMIKRNKLIELGKLYLNFILALFKTNGWSSENEFRIITTPQEMPFVKFKKFYKDGLRDGKKIKIPYIKLPIFNQFGFDQNRLPILSLKVLTNDKFTNVKNDIKNSLNINNDTYIKILNTKTSFRFL